VNVAIESKKPLSGRFYLNLAIIGLIILAAWQLQHLLHGLLGNYLGRYKEGPAIALYGSYTLWLIALPFLYKQARNAFKKLKRRDSQLIVIDTDLNKLEHWTSKDGKISKNCLNFNRLIKLEAVTHKVTGLNKWRGYGKLIMTIGYELEGRNQGFQFKLNYVKQTESLSIAINNASPGSYKSFVDEVKRNLANKSKIDKVNTKPADKKPGNTIPNSHLRYCPN